MDSLIQGDGSAVLVCGDMNIDANNEGMVEEYSYMLEVLGVRDVLHSTSPRRPTLGDVVLVDGKSAPGERMFTSASDQMSQQCVDYILFREDSKRRVQVMKDEVLHMYTPGRPYQRLSDHCAVAVHLHIKELLE